MQESQLLKKHKILSSLPYSPIPINSPLNINQKQIPSNDANSTQIEVYESRIYYELPKQDLSRNETLQDKNMFSNQNHQVSFGQIPIQSKNSNDIVNQLSKLKSQKVSNFKPLSQIQETKISKQNVQISQNLQKKIVQSDKELFPKIQRKAQSQQRYAQHKSIEKKEPKIDQKAEKQSIESDLQKYEQSTIKHRYRVLSSPTKQGSNEIDLISFKKQNEQLLMDRRCRQQLSLFLSAWIEHHLHQKKQWKLLVKAKYHINRLRAKQCLEQMRQVTKYFKIIKLKVIIIQSRIQKLNTQKSFHSIKNYSYKLKSAKNQILHFFEKVQMKKGFLSIKRKAFFQEQLNQARQKSEQLFQKKYALINKKIMEKAFIQLKKNRQKNKHKQEKIDQSDQMRRYLLVRTHFNAIRNYKKLKNRNLINIRIIEKQFEEARKQKLIESKMLSIKRELDKNLISEHNLYKAFKFNMVRSQKYFIQLRAWRLLISNARKQ